MDVHVAALKRLLARRVPVAHHDPVRVARASIASVGHVDAEDVVARSVDGRLPEDRGGLRLRVGRAGRCEELGRVDVPRGCRTVILVLLVPLD